VSDVELEPNGRLVGYGTVGLFVADRPLSDRCEAVDFLSSLGAGIQTSAWQRCDLRAFAFVAGGEYAEPGEHPGSRICWRHLRELGDSGRLDVRPAT
jgi:hypothetical protein